MKGHNVYLCFFLTKYGFPNKLPTPPIVVALFVAYLNESKYAASTVLTLVSAINYIHRVHDMPPPGNTFLVQKAIAGVKKVNSNMDQRLPYP